MTMFANPEYKQLGYDTSNDMIRHDARRGDGLYEQAALHIQRAGIGRVRMGEMEFEEGDFAWAAMNWLSAAGCFYLVPDLERMKECLERVRQLDREGKIPAERRDLHAALKEREEQLQALEGKLAQFERELQQATSDCPAGSRDVLDSLLKQVRELPGYPRLHLAIYTQARLFVREGLAAEHLDWAQAFDPDNPGLVALRAYFLLASGRADQAADLARRLVNEHPDSEDYQLLLAKASSATTPPRPEPVLQPFEQSRLFDFRVGA